jgi:hypothetical protein
MREHGQRIFPTGMFLENLHGGDPLPVRASEPAPEPAIEVELGAEAPVIVDEPAPEAEPVAEPVLPGDKLAIAEVGA